MVSYNHLTLVSRQVLLSVSSVLAALVLISASAGASQDRVVVASSPTGVTDFWGGAGESIALRSDGTVWTWGKNSGGELGNGTTISSSVPIQVSGLNDVVGVSAGDGSTVVVKADGTVWAWGTLRTGGEQFANYYYGPTPVQVAGIDHVTLVRARDWHVLAQKADGTVWAWGWNWKGQCSDGTVGGDKTTPVRVLFPTTPFTFTTFLPFIQR